MEEDLKDFLAWLKEKANQNKDSVTAISWLLFFVIALLLREQVPFFVMMAVWLTLFLFLIIWNGDNGGGGWDDDGGNGDRPILPPDPAVAEDLIDKLIRDSREKLKNKKDPALK